MPRIIMINIQFLQFITLLSFGQFLSKNAEAIKCYVCDSNDNPSCADLTSNSSIIAEDCTLDKMRSIDTWLFELNRFAYFDTGANKSPLMNCQKVIARDPNTNKVVTARFCQLDTGDSDACAILQSKLRSSSVEEQSREPSHHSSSNNIRFSNTNNNNNLEEQSNSNNNGKHDENLEEDEFHCSICTTDSCNGAFGLQDTRQLMAGVLGLFILGLGMLYHRRFC